jgi:hypothetical protein
MSDTEHLEKCSVGEYTKSECHKKSYTNKVIVKSVNTLNEGEFKLIQLRCGVPSEDFLNLCEHHKIFYLKKYETYQIARFDPFERHKKKLPNLSEM